MAWNLTTDDRRRIRLYKRGLSVPACFLYPDQSSNGIRYRETEGSPSDRTEILAQIPISVNLTPAQYNGGQVYKAQKNIPVFPRWTAPEGISGQPGPKVKIMAKIKHTVVLDWLEFMVTGELVHYDNPLDEYTYEEAGVTLVRKKRASENFKYAYEMFRLGRKFATVYCCPRSPEIIKPDFIQVKLENNVLYEFGPVAEAKWIFHCMKWEVRNVTRMDVALDGAHAIQIGNQWLIGDVKKKGKATVTTYFNSAGYLEGYDIGKRSSSKWMTCYVKSREIEKSNKYYIKDFWEKAGLDSEHVERVELKLRNEEIKKIVGFDWTRLDDFEYLASILRTGCKNYFEFIEKGNDTNVTRSKVVEWCDWDAIGGERLEKLSTQETSELYRMKLTAKSLYFLYKATGAQYYADIAQEVVININCVEWYMKRTERWDRQYEYMSGKNIDGEIKFRYLPHYKQYGTNEQLKLFAFEPAVTV